MNWPPQSPKLNISKVVWDHRGRELNKRQRKALECLLKTWRTIPKNLLNTLQERVQAVLRNNQIKTH